MYYVVEDDKKLYFKRGMTESEVRNRFNALSSEQDILSPHRYLSAGYHMFGADFEPIDLCVDGAKEFGVNNNDIVADLGTAEGNFAISIVDMAEKLYLFECDKEWVRALEQTFKPFAHKTVIVEKMVSDRTEFNSVSIDDYFERKSLHFIKADLEGYESKALLGAKNTIETAKHMKIAVCTYHACEHASLFSDYFCERGFDVQFSRGYMHPWTILNASPYLTKGVLRARR
ncbi:hypothetical protein FACS1894204_07100 [Synergistales bacterium]|nr:hypothetical protein FACS1894204_07100 [Synergistales bacterium]